MIATISSRWWTDSGGGAEAVRQLVDEGVDLRPALEAGDAAVEREAHVEVAHVALRDQHRGAEADGGRPVALRRPLPARRRARRRHGLLQHVLIELHPHLADMARLLGAEKVAGAPDVEIVARQAEAGAQAVQPVDHLEPLVRGLARPMPGRQGQIGVAAQLGPPDAPAQLVELGQPEPVRPVHDHGVHPRQIEARFDDRGGDQHVVFAVVEIAHDGIEFARRDLAVGHGDRDFRRQHAHLPGDAVEIGDARADVERLAAAQMLAHQRLAHDHRIIGQDEGAHRQPVDRRRSR